MAKIVSPHGMSSIAKCQGIKLMVLLVLEYYFISFLPLQSLHLKLFNDFELVKDYVVQSIEMI